MGRREGNVCLLKDIFVSNRCNRSIAVSNIVPGVRTERNEILRTCS